MNRKHKNKFGTFLEELRIKKGLTLREFCKKAECDPANISRIERGIFPPPKKHEILEKYVIALGLEKGCDDWIQFFDYAAADQGIIPSDIMKDSELVKILPAFFRTIRNQKPTEAELDKIVDKLKQL